MGFLTKPASAVSKSSSTKVVMNCQRRGSVPGQDWNWFVLEGLLKALGADVLRLESAWVSEAKIYGTGNTRGTTFVRDPVVLDPVTQKILIPRQTKVAGALNAHSTMHRDARVLLQGIQSLYPGFAQAYPHIVELKGTHFEGGNIYLDPRRRVLWHGHQAGGFYHWTGGPRFTADILKASEALSSATGYPCYGLLYAPGVDWNTRYHLDLSMHLLPDGRMVLLNGALFAPESLSALKTVYGDQLIDLAYGDVCSIQDLNFFCFQEPSAAGKLRIVTTKMPVDLIEKLEAIGLEVEGPHSLDPASPYFKPRLSRAVAEHLQHNGFRGFDPETVNLSQCRYQTGVLLRDRELNFLIGGGGVHCLTLEIPQSFVPVMAPPVSSEFSAFNEWVMSKEESGSYRLHPRPRGPLMSLLQAVQSENIRAARDWMDERYDALRLEFFEKPGNQTRLWEAVFKAKGPEFIELFLMKYPHEMVSEQTIKPRFKCFANAFLRQNSAVLKIFDDAHLHHDFSQVEVLSELVSSVEKIPAEWIHLYEERTARCREIAKAHLNPVLRDRLEADEFAELLGKYLYETLYTFAKSRMFDLVPILDCAVARQLFTQVAQAFKGSFFSPLLRDVLMVSGIWNRPDVSSDFIFSPENLRQLAIRHAKWDVIQDLVAWGYPLVGEDVIALRKVVATRGLEGMEAKHIECLSLEVRRLFPTDSFMDEARGVSFSDGESKGFSSSLVFADVSRISAGTGRDLSPEG